MVLAKGDDREGDELRLSKNGVTALGPVARAQVTGSSLSCS